MARVSDSFFGSRFISRAAKTENLVPRSFFAPKQHGNACYYCCPIGDKDLSYFLAQVFLASVEIRKRFRASLSRKLGQEQNKIGMSLFFAPALTFAQLLDGKRLLRRLRYLNKLNKSPGVRGVNPWESC